MTLIGRYGQVGTKVLCLVVLLAPLAAAAQAPAEGQPPSGTETPMQFEVTELKSAEEYQSVIAEAEQLLAGNQFHEGLLALVDVVETGDDCKDVVEYLQNIAKASKK